MELPKLPKVTEAGDLAGTYVVLRASLNVPVEQDKVVNEFRIARALPTINYLRRQGARTIIVAHIGREPEETLEPVYRAFQKYFPLSFSKSHGGELFLEERAAMANGDVILLENIRRDSREIKNSKVLARELAELCDVFVNDAFAASHRLHASIVGVPPLRPSYFGMNFIHEYDELVRVVQPQSPSLFILGGAKFETKIPLVKKLMADYDQVFVGGALANDVFKAKGYEVGTSLVATKRLDLKDLLKEERLLLPIDVTAQSERGVRVCEPTEVDADESILDAGPATLEMLAPYITDAATILWNGPLGNYEEGFAAQTTELARHIATASGYSVVGGGDTIAAIQSLDVSEKFGFLSTAGGAMLTFLETGTLPAIDAVLKQK